MPASLQLFHHRNALDALRDRRLLRELAYVDGNWTAGHDAASFAVTDPATGDVIAWVASLDAVSVEAAIDCRAPRLAILARSSAAGAIGYPAQMVRP